MNIDDLTIGQARELAAMFPTTTITAPPPAQAVQEGPRPVIVCTDKRGVVYGWTTDITARPIKLTHARMCLAWSADVGGVFGLGEIGPTKGCRISARVPSIILEGITGIMSVDEDAVKAWENAPVQGR